MRKSNSMLLLFALAMAGSNASADETPSVDGCVLYGHAGFTGGSFQMAPNDEFVQFSSDIDNKISSVIVGPHCKLEAYSEWLFEGEPQQYPTGSYPAITPNDAMTSARCSCEFVL
jgi:hypothetical protein